MIYLSDLQDELQIESSDLDDLMEYLEIEPFNDMVAGDEAREITEAYLNGKLEEAQRELNLQEYQKMNTKTFKPLENETDEEFRERVDRFADEVSTLAVQFMDDGENGEATSAEVMYFEQKECQLGGGNL